MKYYQTPRLAKVSAVSGLLLLLFTMSNSAIGAEVNCAEIQSDTARLQCFDEQSRRNNNENTSDDDVPVVTSQPETIPIIPSDQAPDTSTVTNTNTEPVVQERIVERIIYQDVPADQPLPEEIRSTIVAISDSETGRKVFLLENGELWQEAREYGLRIEPGTEVVLRKGFFTAYNMTADRNTIRVVKYRPESFLTRGQR